MVTSFLAIAVSIASILLYKYWWNLNNLFRKPVLHAWIYGIGIKREIGMVRADFGSSDHPWNFFEILKRWKGTNERAKLISIIRVLKIARDNKFRHIKIYTDHQFIIEGASCHMKKWIERQWITASGYPVWNKEEWMEYMELRKEIDVDFELVSVYKFPWHSYTNFEQRSFDFPHQPSLIVVISQLFSRYWKWLLRLFDNERLEVWTDGSCDENGRERSNAGIGVYFGHKHPWNVSEPLTGWRHTNNRAELRAVIRALQIARQHNKRIKIYSDSQCVIEGATDWAFKRAKQLWLTEEGVEVQNKADWKEYIELRNDVDVVFQKVSRKRNRKADKLAKNGKNLNRIFPTWELRLSETFFPPP